MAVTARLGITKLEVGQASKEVILNQALDALDSAVALLGLTNAGELYLTENPDVTANYGVLNVGNGGFTGGAGHYSGGANGSLLAINLVSGGTADIINLQINGVSKWKMGSGGNVTLGEGVNMVLGTVTGTKIGSTSAALLGFWGATPIAQQAGTTDLRTGLINIGVFNSTGAMPLNLNGGDITVNQGIFSGALQGSGTALQFKRIAYTFPSDASATLSPSDKANPMIDIQSGVLSAQRDLLVSGNAGAVYLIINREAFPVNVRVGANAGIVVGSHRSRIIAWPGGTVAFSMGPDQDYTV